MIEKTPTPHHRKNAALPFLFTIKITRSNIFVSYPSLFFFFTESSLKCSNFRMFFINDICEYACNYAMATVLWGNHFYYFCSDKNAQCFFDDIVCAFSLTSDDLHWNPPCTITSHGFSSQLCSIWHLFRIKILTNELRSINHIIHLISLGTIFLLSVRVSVSVVWSDKCQNDQKV